MSEVEGEGERTRTFKGMKAEFSRVCQEMKTATRTRLRKKNGKEEEGREREREKVAGGLKKESTDEGKRKKCVQRNKCLSQNLFRISFERLLILEISTQQR